MESMLLMLLFAADDGIPMGHLENVIQILVTPNIHYNAKRRRAQIKRRNLNYYEETIPRFTHDQFKEMFRMDRATCEVSNYIYKIK